MLWKVSDLSLATGHITCPMFCKVGMTSSPCARGESYVHWYMYSDMNTTHTHTNTHTHTGLLGTFCWVATVWQWQGPEQEQIWATPNDWPLIHIYVCSFVCVCASMFWICTCNIHTKWIYGKDKGKSNFGQRLKTDYWWPACIACTTGHWVASSDWRLVTGHLESPHCCPAGGSPALNLIACELCSAQKHLRRYWTVKPAVHT